MEKSEVLIDEKVSTELQFAIYKANEVYVKSLKKYPQTPVMYTLHYSYPKGGREIPQTLLETIYIFRNKLKSIKPLPPKEMHYLKIVKRLEKYKVFIDMSIYGSFLNSMREIIYNENDCIFYKKVIKEYKKAISGNKKDWNINALNSPGGRDISIDVARSFSQTQKFIGNILNDEDFDYVYNGVLQHSDERYRERFIKENESDELIYIIFKCAILANQIRNTLLSDTMIFDEIIRYNKQFLTK